MGVYVQFDFLSNRAELEAYMCVCVRVFCLITWCMNRLFNIDRFQLGDTKRTPHYNRNQTSNLIVITIIRRVSLCISVVRPSSASSHVGCSAVFFRPFNFLAIRMWKCARASYDIHSRFTKLKRTA